MKNLPVKLDKIDRKILMILQEDARAKLTYISRKVSLSVDAVHKRIKKMTDAGVMDLRVMVNPHAIGYPIIVDAKIKLKNTDEHIFNQFISYLKQHSQVVELLQVTGEWDLTCVFIAKDMTDLSRFTNEVRFNFSSYIAEWHALVIVNQFKFEHYDLTEL